MARLYPHVMFKTNIPLEKIEASIRMRRPARTTTADPWDGWPDSPRNCCLKYDRPMEELTGGLWADENTNIVGFPLDLAAPPLPFWSNLFSYYLPDAYARIGDERMHVVRTDRPDPRIAEDLVTRNPVLKLFDVSEIAKVPRQGEFDNVHMAPKLEIARVVKAHFPTPTESPATKTRTSGYLSPGTSTTIDREKCFMTDIVMAPFCAHDCFHMHWRWATVSNPIWNRGWDDTSPHRQAGAPLVPPNQDVWVSMQAPAACDYHVAVGPSADSYFIAPYEWQVIMHHGAAYALDTSDWVTMQRAQLAVDTLGCDAEFYDDEGNRVRVDDSTALFYWLLRYDADFAGNELVGNERTQFADGGLDEARDL